MISDHRKGLFVAHLIIGTAGHIDHGKSTLVRALTGTDPDRLREEKERGMTIDLGFAFLDEGIAFIDVPGHERFIKNMVAGVSTVDAAIMVVAADDGMMPQTREHLDILSLLNVRLGCLVINKIDLAEPEFVDLVEEELRGAVRETFLQQAPVFRLSALTGEGIEPLRRYLQELGQKSEPRPDRGLFWMPVDRAFTVKGFGTVVTGSVVSGKARAGDALELLPDRLSVRVRGVQSHGKPAIEVGVGERAALNINLALDQVERGKTLAAPGTFSPSTRFDARLVLLKSSRKPLKNRSRVRLHIGTREILARVKLLDCDQIDPGQQAFAQLILEEPAVAMRREPFVIRRYSPMSTIGGGQILDGDPPRHKRFRAEVIERLEALMDPEPQESCELFLLRSEDRELGFDHLQKLTGFPSTLLHSVLDSLINDGQVLKFDSGAKSLYYHQRHVERMQQRIVTELDAFHHREPLRPGMSKAEVKKKTAPEMNSRVFDSLLNRCVETGDVEIRTAGIKLARHVIRLSAAEEEWAQHIERLLADSLFSPPSEKEIAAALGQPVEAMVRLVGALQELGRVVRAEGQLIFSRQAVEKAEKLLLDHAAGSKEISVSEFRDSLGTTRKYALALLAYFDDVGRTERVGEIRQIRLNRTDLSTTAPPAASEP
ncbi:selenocysteine-specific translation elongation factor [candidate division KSB1 bacterium]|nr:selenocysteine-specific translation elongation factor [candidate division KSB1 bacterium]